MHKPSVHFGCILFNLNIFHFKSNAQTNYTPRKNVHRIKATSLFVLFNELITIGIEWIIVIIWSHQERTRKKIEATHDLTRCRPKRLRYTEPARWTLFKLINEWTWRLKTHSTMLFFTMNEFLDGIFDVCSFLVWDERKNTHQKLNSLDDNGGIAKLSNYFTEI